VRPSNASEPGSSTPLLGDRSTIGKSLLIKGEITGSESLYVEGKVEGSIGVPFRSITRYSGSATGSIETYCKCGSLEVKFHREV